MHCVDYVSVYRRYAKGFRLAGTTRQAMDSKVRRAQRVQGRCKQVLLLPLRNRPVDRPALPSELKGSTTGPSQLQSHTLSCLS